MPDFLRYRQIHLDFHTSEQLTNIGGEFDAAAWAQQLVDAHVDSITCFVRGHHGMIFHDSQAHAGRRHPQLHCKLLAEQIEAAHAWKEDRSEEYALGALIEMNQAERGIDKYFRRPRSWSMHEYDSFLETTLPLRLPYFRFEGNQRVINERKEFSSSLTSRKFLCAFEVSLGCLEIAQNIS